MPAKNLHRIAAEGIYAHIYNKGVESRVIFSDEQDYETFQGFLKDYLTIPKDPESTKKDFQVKGRTFRGTPHQPKNYFNEVELIAYSLEPDHFHLLLHQKTHGALESFIRSLCTRYSIYFNKKYQRTGSLFQGPYKSALVKDRLQLRSLTAYLHQSNTYSSYPEYLGSRKTEWIKPQIVLSLFSSTDGYKDFVQKEPDQRKKELEGISFESKTEHLERRDLASNQETLPDLGLKSRSYTPNFLAISAAMFVLLVTMGLGNIKLSSVKSSQPLPTPAVLGKTEQIKPAEQVGTAPDQEVKPEVILTIKIDDNESSNVNIRRRPTTSSEKIGQAAGGDTFELVSKDSGWYEVRLTDGSTGFISAKYIKEGGSNN